MQISKFTFFSIIKVKNAITNEEVEIKNNPRWMREKYGIIYGYVKRPGSNEAKNEPIAKATAREWILDK